MENPDYKYSFNVDNCCWKCVCGIRGTERCNVTCPRYTKMHYLLGNSLLPEQWWYPKPFETNENHVDYKAHLRCFQIKDNILEFVNSGRSLIIFGQNTGSGKTHVSTRLLLSYFSKIWELTSFRPRALFIDTQKLLNEFRKFNSPYKDFILSNIATVDLVVWDDIGSGNNSEASRALSEIDYNTLFTLINERELNKKSNIFTTNKTQKQLFDYLGDRLYSRIVVSSESIEFKSYDNRGARV